MYYFYVVVCILLLAFLESVREMQKFAERDQNMKVRHRERENIFEFEINIAAWRGRGLLTAPDAATNETFQSAEKLLYRGIHIISLSGH